MARTYDELTRDELIELKHLYLDQLETEGRLNEVLFNRPADDEDPDKCLTEEMLGRADELVPDDVIEHNYGDREFGDAGEDLFPEDADPDGE